MTDSHTARLDAALAGRYRIERKLGEGGMASVYLAEDVKHERKVALKILRPELAAVIGAERFLAEIKTTANLQHPHILPLFDSGEADSFLYYVMPFIDGETLADRLRRERQLGVDEAVRIAREVADALEHAHKASVIHRDIKPGNILLLNGRPVVADFGIALAVSEAGGGRMTETGLSLGTPHYMSPEQASADRDLSARSDVYSLGCVLYEMLAGQPPHTGPSAQSILVRILTDTPTPLTELRHTVPPHVSSVVQKAIEKLPADRFDSAADFSAALVDEGFRYEVARGTPKAAVPSRAALTGSWLAQRASKVAVAAVAVLALALAAVGSRVFDAPAAEGYAQAVVRFELDSAELVGLGDIALSRDGAAIAIGSATQDKIVYLRLDGSARREWSAAANPVFSPDGRSLLFNATDMARGLRRVSVDGGSPIAIDVGEVVTVPMDWTADGTIYYSTIDAFYRLPEGGEPERLYDEGFVSARWFQVLPGGDAAIFTYGAVQSWETDIRLLDFETGLVETLVEEGFSVRYVPSGHLAYARSDRALVVVPFDLETRSVGQAVSVMDSLHMVRQVDRAFFRVSETGTAVYVRGGGSPDRQGVSRLLARVDLDGGVTPEPRPATALDELGISPDGRRVAYIGDNNNLHVYDLITGADTVLSERIAIGFPVWSPDGSEISVAHMGGTGLFSTSVGPADGSGPFVTIETDFAMMAATDFTPDGTGLFVTAAHQPDGNTDLFVVPRDGGAPAPYLEADWAEMTGVISPDGAWAAYSSDQSGSNRVYVRSFPDPGLPTEIGGGSGPRWSTDGTTLYYQTADSMYAAVLSFESGATVESRRALFGRDTEQGRVVEWDVHPDGGFIGVIEPDAPETEEEEAAGVTPVRGYVVVNWVEEMLRRVSGGGR